MGLSLSDVGRAVGALTQRVHHGVDVVHQGVNSDAAASDGTAYAAALSAAETLQALQRETPRLIARLARNDPGEPEGLDHGRRDAGADARSDRIERGRGDATQPVTGTPGAAPQSWPLGTPVAGDVDIAAPQAPAWQPADAGAGAHASEGAGLADHLVKEAALYGADVLAGAWPEASRNLHHFLGNSGRPLAQDVDQLLRDVPGLDRKLADERQAVAELAVADAQQRGATGPLTYPVQTRWDGYYIGQDQSANWFYALGGVATSQTGQVTVFPPEQPGGAWRYEIETRVNLRDQYNWDGGKSTQIGPLTVTDETLAALHRAGLAQEFLAFGASALQTQSGSMP